MTIEHDDNTQVLAEYRRFASNLTHEQLSLLVADMLYRLIWLEWEGKVSTKHALDEALGTVKGFYRK